MMGFITVGLYIIGYVLLSGFDDDVVQKWWGEWRADRVWLLLRKCSFTFFQIVYLHRINVNCWISFFTSSPNDYVSQLKSRLYKSLFVVVISILDNSNEIYRLVLVRTTSVNMYDRSVLHFSYLHTI